MRENTFGYIPTLNGWRAIAVSAVVLFHSSAIYLGRLSLRPLQNAGQYGVQLFFAISGLLICGRLLDEEAEAGKITFRPFYIRRIFRIQPAAILFLLITAALAAMNLIPMPGGAWVSSMFSFRNIYAAVEGSNPNTLYTNHFWSLAVEEQFYLIFPFLLLLRKSRELFFGILSTAAILWVPFAHYMHLAGEWSSPRPDLNFGYLFFPAFIAMLLLGEWKDWLSRWAPLLALMTGVGFVTSFCLFHSHFITIITTAGFPMVLLATSLRPKSGLSRLLESAPLNYLGKISYSIYLWQQLFLIDVPHFNYAPGILGQLQRWPWNIIATLTIANASYHFVERPLTKYGQSLFRRSALSRIEARL
jgi:peptidoglycan/LPS O-acetylase OafA/YrhL